MKIGILGAADIAYRRFLPAIQDIPDLTYIGVASRTPEKGNRFSALFGGKVYSSYDEMLEDKTIDLVYIPLPPALHCSWGLKAINANKHIIMEKPFTDSLANTDHLLSVAKGKELCVHENYMFLFHHQLRKIKELIYDGTLGNIRGLFIRFGFPQRAKNDFRYSKELGGGALLDCGGYPVRLALELMGESTQVVYSKLGYLNGFEVDMYGNAILTNDDGICAHVSFGMDNAYQCNLEIWGSRATLIANRIFTPGSDYAPVIIIRTSNDESFITVEPDDHFKHSVEEIICRIQNNDQSNFSIIRKQAELIEKIKEGAR